MDEEYIDSFGKPYKYEDIISINKRPQEKAVCPKCDSKDVKRFFSDAYPGEFALYRAQCQECETIVEWAYGEG